MKKRLSTILTTAGVVLLPAIVIAQEAAEGGEAHHSGLPMVVYLQAVNFVLYAALLVYLMRKPVREYFSGRTEKFNAALNKAAAAKAEAEARKQEVQAKINDLQASSAQELLRAKADAADLQVRIMKEAEAISAHLRTEANRTATMEIERAKNELRESLLSQSVAFSAKLLKEKIVEGDQKRLQTEFVDKIGANR
jgi:F-type H+-transporting ATPase subunit b